MTYIAGLVIVGLFFLALKYFAQLSKKQELIIGAIVLAIVFSAIAFNTYSTQQRDSMLGAVLKFKQSKTIDCKGIDVNNSNYTLSIGTYTFIGKKDTPNYGQMISASTCK
jgi:cbb3-type cytochrome oxidase subunit 3